MSPSPEIHLYHCPTARSFRPLWTIEEMGLSYALTVLPFPPRVLARDYLKINPLGTVPGFSDGDVWMTESVAICEYVVARYGPTPLSVSPSDPEFGAYLNWLYFGEATLTFPLSIVLRYTQLEPPERQASQVVEDYTRMFFGRFRAVETALQSRDYLCCSRFSLADISVGLAIMTADYLGLLERMSPAVHAYWDRLRARESYVRAVAAGARALANGGRVCAVAAARTAGEPHGASSSGQPVEDLAMSEVDRLFFDLPTGWWTGCRG